MSANKLYSEILEEFSTAEGKNSKISVLRKYGDHRFKQFLFAAFHPKIIFDVEVPKYRPALEPAGLNYTYLDSEISKMYRFIKGHPKRPPTLSPEKQRQLLLVVLESLHKDEADLFVKLIKKDLGVKFLTPKLVEEAFPDIFKT
jgi:hypothetical protein